MSADLIVTGAQLHTVDPQFARAEAFAVRDGRFIYVGSESEALGFRTSDTIVLDLYGKTILPGLVDAHIHLTGVGLDLQCANLVGARSLEEVIDRVRAFAATSDDAWITGNNWDQNHWPQKAWPSHHLLSAAFPTRPVALRRVDSHALFVNAAAMRIAGVTATTPEPDGGQIVRDTDGTPTGVFVDNAMRLINAHMPQPTEQQLIRAVQAAVRECNRFGVTTVAEAGTPTDFLAAQEVAIALDSFTVRNYAMLPDDEQLLARMARGPMIGAHDGRLWVRAIKIFADGALGSRGAALLEPYCDDCKSSGFMTVSQEHVEEVTRMALRSGFQVCTHAIGDRANRLVLDAYETVLREVPRGDYRLRIEHAQVVHESDLPRFKTLGVIPSMQSCHELSERDWTVDRLGSDRLRRAYQFRQLIDAGSAIANGTDAPVEPVDSRRTYYSAITASGKAMSRDEAIRSMTIWAAYACFLENDVGSISPGKYADFVVMDRDWATCAIPDILETTIEATYFAGAPTT